MCTQSMHSMHFWTKLANRFQPDNTKLVPMCVKLKVQPGVSVYSTAVDDTQTPAASYTSVRESQHYIHEQEWFKSGELGSFNYLPSVGAGEEMKAAIKVTNTAVADIHQLNSVIHSLRQQLKILRTKDESQLKMWRLDWDFVETFDDPVDSSLPMEDSASHSYAYEESTDNLDRSKKTLHSTSSLSSEQSSERLMSTNELDIIKSNEHSGVDSHITPVTENNKNGESVSQASETTVTDHNVSQASKTTISDERDCSVSGPSSIETRTGGKEELGETGNEPDEGIAPPVVGGEVLIGAHETEVSQTVVNDGCATNVELPTLPLQPHVYFTLDEDATNSDSTENAVEDPIESYEKNLLQHIVRTQTEIDTRLQLIEEQVVLLEQLESRAQGMEGLQPHTVLADLHRLRRTVHTLDNDLDKVKRMAIFH